MIIRESLPFLLCLLALVQFPITTKAAPLPDAKQLIAQCEQKQGADRFKLHLCLLHEFERLEKRTDQLTDQLLGKVGAHRSLGRLKIIQWSNAITKSQLRWQALVPWDCEWQGHILPSLKGAAVAIDRCGIERAAKRVILLEKRMQTLNSLFKKDRGKDK